MSGPHHHKEVRMNQIRSLNPLGLSSIQPFHSPFKAIERLMSDMDDVWGDGVFSSSFSGTNTSELYRSEDGKTYLMKVPVPGFQKEEITIDVSKNHISVDAARIASNPEGFSLLIRQALPSSLSYREQVPATLDASTAEAELKDGVLSVTVSCVSKESKGNKIVIK